MGGCMGYGNLGHSPASTAVPQLCMATRQCLIWPGWPTSNIRSSAMLKVSACWTTPTNTLDTLMITVTETKRLQACQMPPG